MIISILLLVAALSFYDLYATKINAKIHVDRREDDQWKRLRSVVPHQK